jgi:hypothetical protein
VYANWTLNGTLLCSHNKNYEENKLKETAMAPNYYVITKKNLDFVKNDELWELSR